MRVFLAGATGVIGRGLVPALVAAGHEVVGTTRHADRASSVRAAGAAPMVLDPLDRPAVRDAVARARPDMVMHQLTALGQLNGFRRMDQQFATTNALRTRGLDYLLDAAADAGARRFVAQSFSGWPNARTGGPVADEDHPLDEHPPRAARQTLSAIRHIESTVPTDQSVDHGPLGRVAPRAAQAAHDQPAEGSHFEGVVLRYGFLYGPGTGFEDGGRLVDLVHRRQFPIVGDGGGVWSFVHITDAVNATVAAVDGGAPGVYNITDDEPAPVAHWLPYLADVLDAPPPRHLPAWVARPVLGGQGVVMMTASRGSSNARAKRDLGWDPTYPSWREGFRTGLG